MSPMQIPADPPEEAKEPKLVSPVTFLNTERYRPEVPEGTIHPSQNRKHVIEHVAGFDQEVVTIPADMPSGNEEDEPTESDREPLLLDVEPNALKGSALEE